MAARRQDSNNMGQFISGLWYKYFPYWPVFVLFICLCSGVAWYYLQHQLPKYPAVAKILLKDERKGYNESKVAEELDAAAPKNTIDNEVEVIKSRSLMAEVVRNLDLYAPIYEEGRFVARSAYTTSPFVIIARNPDSLMESGKIPVRFDEKTKEVVLEDSRHPMNAWVKTKYGELKFQPNKFQNGSPKSPLFFYLVPPQNMALGLASSIDVNLPNRASNIVYLNLVDEVPVRAENILNELMSVYHTNALIEKSKQANNMLTFVEKQIDSVKHDLDSIERKNQQYKENKDAVDISVQGQMFLSNISEVDKQISGVDVQLDILNNVQKYVSSRGDDANVIPSSIGLSDPQLSQLLEKYYDAQLKYEKSVKSYGENHPTTALLLNEVNKVRPTIMENIQNQKRNLQITKSNLSRTNNQYSSMLQSIPMKERNLIEITRAQANKNDLYNYLLQKKQETSLSLAASIPGTRIIDRAVALYVPVSPNPRRTYMMAVIAAFLICMGLIAGKEIFNRTILFRYEIEKMTSLPVIGEIAYDRSKAMLMNDESKSFIGEQFRKLRTSLTFLGISSTKKKKILVTSTIPGEGKSYIAANLGLSLALTGKKVILLEFDLVHPTLSSKLFVDRSQGLTNYLIGDLKMEDLIVQTNVNEHLYVIPAGPLPENPSEMLLSSEVPALLHYLDRNFDYIIIDTAPVGPMTDAYVLSSYCDATLYVVRHKFTPKVLIERIDEESKINHLKNAAIVFNAVKARGFNKNSYGYGYGYGYAYNYNYKVNDKREKLVSKKAKS